MVTATTPTGSVGTHRPRVALVTGGSRGIGRGIVEDLVESGDYQGILITYNRNQDAAEQFEELLKNEYPQVKVVIVGGDLTESTARDAIFQSFDENFAAEFDLSLMVHNAGQYAGVTSDNGIGLEAPSGGSMKFGDGSLMTEDGKVNLEYMTFYHKLYSEAYVDLCERSLVRMKEAHSRQPDTYRGCLIGISSPGCNHNFKITTGYDMPGSGKCVMEFANRYYALNAAPFNVNVNVIIPGVTRSDAWGKIAEKRGSDRDSFLEKMKGVVPMKQVVEAKELGSVITFLSASSGGGRYITGQSIRVDGGLHLK